MNQETLRDYCLSKKYATEDFPFDELTLVLKVGGKMFALIPLDSEACISLKCNPELAIELREQYPAVQPAYHFNKKHWNQVFMDGSISENLVKEWIDHSYELVYKSLTRKIKEALEI
jgi:predicted DNA-binding protein (MmcQ/YjbR family)